MTINDLIEYYGDEKTAKSELTAMGVSDQLFRLWRRIGIPVGRQWWLHAKTGLAADEWV